MNLIGDFIKEGCCPSFVEVESGSHVGCGWGGSGGLVVVRMSWVLRSGLTLPRLNVKSLWTERPPPAPSRTNDGGGVRTLIPWAHHCTCYSNTKTAGNSRIITGLFFYLEVDKDSNLFATASNTNMVLIFRTWHQWYVSVTCKFIYRMT